MSGWAQRAVLLGLSPVLAAQGVYTRIVTPRLPEAAGPREGRLGQGPRLRLLVTGDSAAAGVGVQHQHEALAGQLAQALSAHFDLSWKLVARNGYTTRELLGRLASETAEPFDVVAVSLGVNDVTGLMRTADWIAQQQALVALLQGRFRVQRVLLTCVPPMHEMRALPQPLRWQLGQRARHFNAQLTAAAALWPGCTVVFPALDTRPDALARDRFHPGAQTYRQWALQLAELIRAAPRDAG